MTQPLLPASLRVKHRTPNGYLGVAIRCKILELLSTEGPATAAEIAEDLGKPVQTTYKHIRTLYKDAIHVSHWNRRYGANGPTGWTAVFSPGKLPDAPYPEPETPRQVSKRVLGAEHTWASSVKAPPKSLPPAVDTLTASGHSVHSATRAANPGGLRPTFPKDSTMTETQTPAAAPKFCSKTIDVEAGTVTWTFGNGNVQSISLSDIPEDTQTHCALHGISQKGGDSYASAGGDYAFAESALKTTLSNLISGTFNAVRQSDGASKGNGELCAALVRLGAATMAEATTMLENATDEVKKALRGNSEIKLALAEIRADRAREKLGKVDASAPSLADTLASLKG